jgi:hypothetical protein
VGKFGIDFGFVSEKCFPYSQIDKKCAYKCSAKDKIGNRIGYVDFFGEGKTPKKW